MAIKKITRPYEFLVRWGDDGAVSGAHVQFLEEVRENGAVLASKVGDALPVSMAGGAGFPLADVLAAVHAGAISASEAATARERAALRRVRELESEVATLTAQRDKLTAQRDKAQGVAGK